MFKRVAKRIRKQEREEELGLDSEMKEVLGMNNIDSDDDSSDSDAGESSGDGRPSKKARKDISDEDSDEESDEDESEEDEELDDGEDDGGLVEEEDEDEEEDEEEDGEPPMSVSEALQSPLYIVSLEPEMKACIVCPGKLIKNPIMGDVHLKSTAHTRRFTRVREAAMAVDADTDVRLLVRAALAPQEAKKPVDTTSKRAQKKKAKLEAIKAKRLSQKAMKAKAKARKAARQKAAASSDADDSDGPASEKLPVAKKRKVQQRDGADDVTKTGAKKPKLVKPAPSQIDAPPESAKKVDARPGGKSKPKAQMAAGTSASPTKPSSKMAESVKSKKRKRSGPTS
ncbi:hypothetical protein BC628DRAFT_1414134 [Trametes gibbosa]|nr:hypothetical protein BC628DRAFT_1414134 [Trametes gibbosa]